MLSEYSGDPKDMEVFYEDDLRRIRCFCGSIINTTIIPHMENEHPKIWEKWCQDFVTLYNDGFSLRRITKKYLDKNHRLLFTWSVVESRIKRLIEAQEASIKLKKNNRPSSWEPKRFQLESSTLWNFPDRGNWAVHTGNYRGNWPPEIPRNLILRYSNQGNLVLDPFVGGGTTLIEAWLTGRKSIGIDISPFACQISKSLIENMEFMSKNTLDAQLIEEYKPEIILEDVRNIIQIMQKLGFGENSVDLILVHPPYFDALKYTEYEEKDLSHIHDVETFIEVMQSIAKDLFKLLNKEKICAVLIGDVRKEGITIPLGFKVMDAFLKEGFELLYSIVKTQHKDRSTAFFYGKNLVPYLIAHEYLFILKKPVADDGSGSEGN